MKSYNELLAGAKSLLKDATRTRSKANTNNSSVMIAAIVGVAAGAILGILLAPDKGSETRHNISNSLGNLGATIRDKAMRNGSSMDTKDTAADKVRSRARSAADISQTKTAAL